MAQLELKVNRVQTWLKVNWVCLVLKVSKVNREKLELEVNPANLGLKVKRASKVTQVLKACRASLDLKEKPELQHQVISDQCFLLLTDHCFPASCSLVLSPLSLEAESI